MYVASLIRPRWLLAAITAALVVVVGLMLSQTAQAGSPPDLDSTQCKFFSPGLQYCISLNPATGTNPVDDDHTATATLSKFVNGEPADPEAGELEGIYVHIIVLLGPNTAVEGLSGGESQSVIAPTSAESC